MPSVTAHAGERVRRLRAERDWTQPQLAKQAKVSMWTITQLEVHGRVPSLRLQHRIARAFNIPRELIFAEAA